MTTKTNNSWVDNIKDDEEIVVEHGERPGYFDKSHPWPQLERNKLSGAAVFCEWVENTSGNAQPAVRFKKDVFVKGMYFNEPDDVLPQDTGRHVKAVRPDGSYTQIPMVTYINGETGSPMSGMYWAKGKGFHVEFDEATKRSLFCLASNCFAKAMTEDLMTKYPQHARAVGTGYCSISHALHGEPNKYRPLIRLMGLVDVSPADMANLDKELGQLASIRVV